MPTSLTKYVAASALAGFLAFGGYAIAGAQDAPSTTTTTTEQPSTTTEAPPTTSEAPSTDAPAPPDANDDTPGTPGTPGQRPDGAGCDHDKGGMAGGGMQDGTETAPDSGGTQQSNSTST